MSFKRKLDGFTFVAPATVKGKKYSVYDSDGKYITSFGSNAYEQYHDKIGHYSSKDHLDKKRRDNYRKRHAKDNLNELSAGYFSWHYLW